jgi:hypothetical protein
MDDALAKVMGEANGMFDKMRAAVEEAVAGGATQLDVMEIARKSGLQLDDKTLDELQIDRVIPVLLIPWHYWWPWRPLWCWWCTTTIRGIVVVRTGGTAAIGTLGGDCVAGELAPATVCRAAFG